MGSSFHAEFDPVFDALPEDVQDELLAQAKLLQLFGPRQGRPRADTLKGSRHANMKELRFGAADGVWRVAFAFDTDRKAVLLVCGDKSGGSERRFYRQLIEKADHRFDSHLDRIKRRKPEAKEGEENHEDSGSEDQAPGLCTPQEDRATGGAVDRRRTVASRVAPCPQINPGTYRRGSRYRTGSGFPAGTTHRSPDFHASWLCGSHGRPAQVGRGVPRPPTSCAVRHCRTRRRGYSRQPTGVTVGRLRRPSRAREDP